MIRIMQDLPANVLGVSARGRVTGTDYDTVLMPAVEEKLKTNEKLSLLYDRSDSFTDYDMVAMMDDDKTGIKHLAAWHKVALVSDHKAMNGFANFYGNNLSCQVCIFNNTELEAAKKWIMEG